jgi:N-acetylneuraminic acid mutarotase
MLLYGGCSSGFGPCPQGDLWSFNPTKRRWRQIDTDAAPAARSNPGLVFDNPRNRALLFGGLSEAGFDRALWSLTGVDNDQPVWTEIPGVGELPPARASHDAVITGPHLYVFGGTGGIEVLNDLWTINVKSITAA